MMRWGRPANVRSEHWKNGVDLGSSDVTTALWARLAGTMFGVFQRSVAPSGVNVRSHRRSTGDVPRGRRRMKSRDRKTKTSTAKSRLMSSKVAFDGPGDAYLWLLAL